MTVTVSPGSVVVTSSVLFSDTPAVCRPVDTVSLLSLTVAVYVPPHGPATVNESVSVDGVGTETCWDTEP